MVNIIANIIMKIYALLTQDRKNQEWQTVVGVLRVTLQQ